MKSSKSATSAEGEEEMIEDNDKWDAEMQTKKETRATMRMTEWW